MTRKASFVLGLLAFAYAAPVAIYVVKFGPIVGSDHQRWAEFGSAMAGIYAPIVALTTLAVLSVQVGLQRQMNKHQNIEAHIQQARADIEFYATQLAIALKADLLPGKAVLHVLHESFLPQAVATLDSPDLRALAINLNVNAPSALGMWFAIYPIFAGLCADKNVYFDMTLQSSKQKLIALLSFETCVALDNYHRALTEGQLRVRYAFSPLLEDSASDF